MMESILPTKRLRISGPPESGVNLKLCIICQTTTEQSLTSTENGRQKIIEAAEIRNDNVTERLKLVGSDIFVYHVTNDCYKNYTLKKTLDKLKKERDRRDELSGTSASSYECAGTDSQFLQSAASVRRSSVSSRDAPSQHDANIYTRSCVICGNVKHNGEYQKFRISEKGRAEAFLRTALLLSDEVYIRTCDLQDASAVFGADLYCHKTCIRNYIRKGETVLASGSASTGVDKMNIFKELVRNIESGLNTGKCYAISELCEFCNKICKQNEAALSFANRDIRMYLLNEYGDECSFIQPRGSNQSTLVFKRSRINIEPVESRANQPDCFILKECGELLRKILLAQDFNLGDKFCDANDLENASTGITIPDEILTFFSALFDLAPAKPIEEASDMSSLDSDSDEDTPITSKLRKIKTVYQILFFIVHNGKKRTPFHLMTAQAIHSTCKSKTLISCLNRFGLAVSYDEVLRYHTDMAAYMHEVCDSSAPLPSHFDPQLFTIGAFDNFDHEEGTLSGIGGTHDTVLVLMQDKPAKGTKKLGKPNVSTTGVSHGARQFEGELKCQILQHYIKPAKRPTLSTEYLVAASPFKMDQSKHDEIVRKDIAWLVGRLNLSDLNKGVSEYCESQTMPDWSAFNSLVTEETVPEKDIGFLPVLPHPVTEYSTVYTAMKTFQGIAKQLSQSNIPITCDEGVYHIAREIVMNSSAEFSNIILCLGSFHMIKVVMGAIGKYIDGCGAENILIETQVFGPNVVKSVLQGTHYVRSLKGLMLLAETMDRLQWSEFFKITGVDPYRDELTTLSSLKEAVERKDRDCSQKLLQAFMGKSSKMVDDFLAFTKEQSKQSETFSFWKTFIEMVATVRDLVRADREGNWQLHLQSVQAALPLFAACDRTNYMRWASLYLEDMRQLQYTAPDVYDNFMAGRFSVKRTPGFFKAVGADMCLEQTINRTQKSQSGIIGSTKKKRYVTQWEMIYHEMLAVANLYREVSGVKAVNEELFVKKEFSKAATKKSEEIIKHMIMYISVHENPATVEPGQETKLHNILTQEVATEEIRQSLLGFSEDSQKLYQVFRVERMVEKKKSIFETIHKHNLKNFKALETRKKPSEGKSKDRKRNKELAEAQKIFDIARLRNYDIKQLLQYDLIDSSYLFDDDGLMTKPVKSDLCRELEQKYLKDNDYHSGSTFTKSDEGTLVFIVDVMAWVRKIRLSTLRTFGELVRNLLDMILRMSGNADRVDFILDTYAKGSVKDSERIRRSHCSPIEVSNLTMDTKLPVSMDAFWASTGNKAKLQQLLRDYILGQEWTDTVVVVSGTGISEEELEPCMIIQGKCGPVRIPELDVRIEEADVRLLPHVVHAINTGGATKIILLSNDTDILVLTLHFWVMLKSNGLVELWMRGGVGDTTRYIPLHTLGDRLGGNLCQVLPAIHHLSGCDISSKFGTKAAALKANPERLLTHFGKGPHNLDLVKTEEYLVQVYKAGTSVKTMDELRFQLYHHSKKTIIDLPPTSRATKGHILRSFYGTFLQMHCLEGQNLDPTEYGFYMENGLLKPSKCQVILPADFPSPCKCTTCGSKRCPCIVFERTCCSYCSCQMAGKCCKNPFVEAS